MALDPPLLDDRDFDSLFKEARSRIPRYLPEWTDWNDSDPGITLLQLHAWLTETILFRLNRLPELNHVKFLEMIGVDRMPARPAEADLTFTLNPKKVTGPQALIPKGTLVSVSAPDLEEPLFFETDRTLTALAARLADLVAVDDSRSPTPLARRVTEDNSVDGATYTPFGDTVQVSGANAAQPGLLLGFASELPFSREEVGLQVYLAETGGELLAPPPVARCGAPEDEPDAPAVAWEWWDGTRWSPLTVTGDETGNLTRSGQVYFKVPGQIPAVAAHAAFQIPVFALPRLEDVRGVDAAAAQKLRTANVKTVAELAALSEDQLLTILGLKPNLPDKPKPEDIQRVKSILADAKRLNDRVPPLLYWLRAVFRAGRYPRPVRVARIATNTVRATAAQTVFDEGVGGSEGTPNQVLRLRHAPVLADPPLELEVDEGDGFHPWVEVPDFFASTSQDPHYVLDRSRGEIRFGDGRRGRIPVAGLVNVVVRRYRHGGGRAGNVGSNTITDLVRALPEVESVTNFRPGEGGADEEPLSDTMLRAAHDLKSQERAVTLEDFAFLAQKTPGGRVARAQAYVEMLPETPQASVSWTQTPCCGGPVASGGRIITVVVVPSSQDPKPVPAEASLRRVCRYLDERRLITTRLRVVGPTYQTVDVQLDLRARGDADLRDVRNAVEARLRTYLHPLRGGAAGKGWPFGRDLYASELTREVMLLPGVLRIQSFFLHELLAEFDDELDADADAARRGAEAPGSSFDVLRLQKPGDRPSDPPAELFVVFSIYECADLPIRPGALPFLREVGISVSYDRGEEGM